jgi:hypothetical protein
VSLHARVNGDRSSPITRTSSADPNVRKVPIPPLLGVVPSTQAPPTVLVESTASQLENFNMEAIRSTGRAAVPIDDEYLIDSEYVDHYDWFLSDWPTPDVHEYEDSLPDPTEEDWWPDEYEDLWYRRGDATDFDDAPAWELDVLPPCSRCGKPDDLDPNGTCSGCRLDDHRCSWCGLDPIVYEYDAACRTCYQRLRRSRVTNEPALHFSMLDAAFRRADLRKRRDQVGSHRDHP